MKKSILVLLLSLIMSPVFADKEGILPLSVFYIESAGIGSSGKIVIEGQQNKQNQISQLIVHAFGKKYVIPQKNLDQLSKITINGIQISYAHGYRELGGREVYIQFQKGFTSGIAGKVTMILRENGEISML